MVVPFALWTPVFLALIVSSVEIGTITIRHTVLERALDRTVRDMRISGAGASSEIIKQGICDRSPALAECMARLQLEMIKLDMRDWVDPPLNADCTDTSLLEGEVTPMRNFQHGGAHEMMLIRACYKFKPVTPAGMVGGSLGKDDEGYTAIVSTSAFVHEPT